MAKATRANWLIPIGLIVLSTVPVTAGTARLAELAGGAAITPENARFFAAPLPVVLHIASVTIYSLLGAFQFSPGFRRRSPGWHRSGGKVLVVAGFVAALSGLWMTSFYPWPPGDGGLTYAFRLVFGSAMAIVLSLAVRDIFRRDFASHGRWMTRAYAIGLGAGTQVFTHLPYFMLIGLHPGELPRGVMMGAGWVINVVVAEWIIGRKRSTTCGWRTSPERSVWALFVGGMLIHPVAQRIVISTGSARRCSGDSPDNPPEQVPP